MPDETMAAVLDAILSQQANISGKYKQQYLQQLIYSNGIIGVKTMEKLLTIVPNLVEIALSNVKFIGYRSRRTNLTA